MVRIFAIVSLGLLSASSSADAVLGGEKQQQQQQQQLSDADGESNTLLEPIVSLFRGVLPPHVCKELIDIGEREGFNVYAESIDAYEEGYKATGQTIDVYERYSGVQSPAIWNVLEPWIPKLTELVKSSIDSATDAHFFPDQPDRVPKLDWVFFRKYSPDTDRNSLLLHVDSNMHTLNIALNDDFVGGGLMYVKPEVAIQDPEALMHHNDSRPLISDDYRSYDWLNNVKRQNTSDIVFPTLGTGDVLVHNFTVWHAVAPLEKGTRYSFVIFYDMDNPAIQVDFQSPLAVEFYHEIEDMDIDLVYVEGDENGSETIHVVEEKMPPFQIAVQETYEGHKFRAVISGEDTVLAEFEMREDQKLYTIKKICLRMSFEPIG
ncbi:hypothetical protein ACHAXH_004978 [Discostella pseudostelligera]